MRIAVQRGWQDGKDSIALAADPCTEPLGRPKVRLALILGVSVSRWWGIHKMRNKDGVGTRTVGMSEPFDARVVNKKSKGFFGYPIY